MASLISKQWWVWYLTNLQQLLFGMKISVISRCSTYTHSHTTTTFKKVNGSAKWAALGTAQNPTCWHCLKTSSFTVLTYKTSRVSRIAQEESSLTHFLKRWETKVLVQGHSSWKTEPINPQTFSTFPSTPGTLSAQTQKRYMCLDGELERMCVSTTAWYIQTRS